MTAPQVLVVGAGVTGSLLAMLLKDMGLSVRVFEKSRGPGGRMATHRFRQGGRDGPVLGRADLGAQYITTRSPPDHPELGPVYERLLSADVLRPFTGEVAGPNPYGGAGAEVRHFSAPQGLQSISEHFLEAAGGPVQWGTAVEELSLDEEGRVLVKLSDGDGSAVQASEPCIVVLTQPVPQALGESKYPIRGNYLDHVDAAGLTALRKVQYSSRFAAAFFFEAPPFRWPYSWTAQYFEGGAVRYVAHDTAKRGATDEPTVSVLVHSGVPLGMELADEPEPFEAAAERMRRDLEEKLPEVPWRKAAAAKVHKWRYSQVYKGLGGLRPDPSWAWSGDEEAAPGFATLFRTGHALGILCGDATAPASNFEGCVFSAKRTVAAIRDFLATGRADL